jgi:hypothetical protein
LRRTVRVYTRKDIDRIPALRQLTQAERLSMIGPTFLMTRSFN